MLVVCALDHGVTEEEPVDEQCCEQVCDPEPEGQYHDQDFSEGLKGPSLVLVIE